MNSRKKLKTIGIALMAFFFGLFIMFSLRMGVRQMQETMPRQGQQITAVLSPDQAYTARVWRPDIDGLGAAMPQPYEVWIENKRSELKLILKASRTAEISIKWLSARELEICYNDAQIDEFRSPYRDFDRTMKYDLRSEEDRTTNVILRRVTQFDECRL